MDKNLMLNILLEAGYTKSAAQKGIELGTIIMDDQDDFKREFPEIEPEVVTYEGIKYYIAYAN